MTPADQPELPPDTERQLQALVDSYIDHIQTGDQPDLVALMAKHLAVVKEAAQRLSTVAVLHGVGQTAPDAEPPTGTKPPPLQTRYQLGTILGKGHSAIVYQARDTLLGRDVAVKVLRADQADDPDLGRRFERDAQIAAKLRHPNIVPVHDYGNDGERLYLVMELIEGETLEDRLIAKDRPPLSPRESAELVRQIAEALDHAHQQGVIHRDVKPSNILLQKSEISNPKSEVGHLSDFGFRISDFFPLLTDFGLARQVNAREAYTVEGQVLGTPAYLPPEQAHCRRGREHRIPEPRGTRRRTLLKSGILLSRAAEAATMNRMQFASMQGVQSCPERRLKNEWQHWSDRSLSCLPITLGRVAQRIGVARAESLPEMIS